MKRTRHSFRTSAGARGFVEGITHVNDSSLRAEVFADGRIVVLFDDDYDDEPENWMSEEQTVSHDY